MNRAVFLDRDGVLNKLVYHERSGEYGPPHLANELELYDYTIDSLSQLSGRGFKLFLISNQPDHAKGKASIETLKSVHNEFHNILSSNQIKFEEYFYCYHHPKGIHPEYSGECDCRKPSPYFVLNAIENYKLVKAECWIVGDRDSDINCGKNAGIKTVLVKNVHSENYRGQCHPDFTVADLKEAVNIISNSLKNFKI